MSHQTKTIKEAFGNPDKDGHYSGAYIFSDGTAEFVCGYAAATLSDGSEEYHNSMPATPDQVYAKYGKPQESET